MSTVSESGMNLEGKVAIVTGGGQGIGKAIIQRLAEEGAKVVIADLNMETMSKIEAFLSKEGREVLVTKVDVVKFDEVKAMVELTLKKFGSIDILVNNAGVLRKTPLEDISEKEWDFVIDVNMKGTFNCTKAVLPTMKGRRSGRIVNISSVAGRSSSRFGGAHYTASKAGILGLTRHTAMEVASYNILVNAVAPGGIDTSMIRSVSTPEWMEEFESKVPLRRIGEPDDIAKIVLFLCMDLSSYMTGATIDVNAGSLMI